MNDAENGDASPDSGAHEPGKPQKSGKKRRRWRRKKKRSATGDTGGIAPSSGQKNPESAQNKSPDMAIASHGMAPCAAASGDRSATTRSTPAIGDFESAKKSRRKRRRRAKNNILIDGQPTAPKQQASGQPPDPGQRHRRQPMAQKAPASYKNPNGQRGKNVADGSSQQPKPHQPNRHKHRPQGGPHAAPYHKKPRTYYAALDLGTNNCRLLVAVPQAPGRFRVVDAFSRIVRLGEGLGASGSLSEDAMDRTIEALKICRDKLRQRTKTRHRLIATEACRQAGNGQVFLDRVRAETGLELEIVDRETEARLAVSGCGSLVDNNADGVVLFDIGGGSSELALLDITKRHSRRLSDHITSWASLPLGVVTLSEKFGGGKHVTPEIFENMVVEVATMLDQFEGRHALAHTHKSGRFHLLGTSGTVTTLAGVHLNLRRYDRRRVDGAWLSNHEVDTMIARILNMSFEDRVNNPCIGADRADLVLAGCAILEAIRRLWPSPRLRVADRGLREGLLSEMMAEDGVWRKNRRRHKYPNSRPQPPGTGTRNS